MYRSALAQLLPCMFLTLLPVQVFPETVNAVFVSKPLPQLAPLSLPTAEAKRKHSAPAGAVRRLQQK